MYCKGRDIRLWMEGLSMTALSDHTRRAGECRLKYATGMERKLVGRRLRPYRLSKEEACQRLTKARAVKARMKIEQEAGTLNLSNRPRLPR
jgi:hypothetical protein